MSQNPLDVFHIIFRLINRQTASNLWTYSSTKAITKVILISSGTNHRDFRLIIHQWIFLLDGSRNSFSNKIHKQSILENIYLAKDCNIPQKIVE